MSKQCSLRPISFNYSNSGVVFNWTIRCTKPIHIQILVECCAFFIAFSNIHSWIVWHSTHLCARCLHKRLRSLLWIRYPIVFSFGNAMHALLVKLSHMLLLHPRIVGFFRILLSFTTDLATGLPPRNCLFDSFTRISFTHIVSSLLFQCLRRIYSEIQSLNE